VVEVRGAFEREEPVRLLLVDRDASASALDEVVALARAKRVDVRCVSSRSIRRLAGPGEPADALALVGPDPRANLEETLRRGGAVWLLVGTGYPGNAGLAARTAEVSGAAGVCIDAPFDAAARKACLRASMRTDRLMPVHFASADVVVAGARASGRRIVVVEDVGDRAPWDVDLTLPSLFVVGGEADGVPAPLVERADACIRVPTPGFVSSYNLQAAMAVVVGERLRQLLA
jgi:tRNA G18 (ribose-2'-O)-methylase SpoU